MLRRDPTQPYSLRFRLLVGGAVSVLLALTIAGLLLSGLFETQLRRRFDRELSNHVDQLAANLDASGSGQVTLARPLSDPRFLRPLSGLYWQVATESQPLLRSRSLWDAELRLPPDALTDGDEHRHIAPGPDGIPLVVLERSVRLPGRDAWVRLAVAESQASLDQVQHEFDRTLALSLATLVLVLTLAAAIQVSIGLRPLERLRAELAEIRSGKRRSFDTAMPAEVRPLVEDLNHLLVHGEEVVTRARVQAGNLAHALKTGLAVIANDLDGREAPLVRERLDGMLRSVNHHLSRARAAAASGIPGWRTEMAEVVTALQRTLLSLYAERGLRIETHVEKDLVFAGEREDLEEMLGNLMDNACKWAASRVVVRAGTVGDGRLVLTVEDDGPGMPEGAETRLLTRGVRLDETVPGSGLGLGIVRDLCLLYGGELSLGRSGSGGVKVELTLRQAVAR
ncbi:MAG: sensor histidine kinase [Alphaproteobacteria bacterium]